MSFQFLRQLSNTPGVYAGSQNSAIKPPPRVNAAVPEVNRSREDGVTVDHLPNSTAVPFHRGIGNHIYVTASVNSRPIEVIFDTGAEGCFFGKRELANAGISYAPVGNMTTVGGVGSQMVKCEEAYLDISLGDITKRTLSLIAVPSANTSPLIGQTFFRDFRYEVDTAAGLIRFHKKGGRTAEAYDTIDVPFRDAGNNMLVQGKINGIECPMYFDTGAFGILIPTSLWHRLGLAIPNDAETVLTSGVGGTARGFRFKVDRIELGPIIKTNVEVVVSNNAPPYPLLGQTFFKDKQFSIDNENHLIRFVH